MGVDLRDLVTRRRVRLQDLSGRTIAVDGFNTLYQFLSIIRGVDGRPLMDKSGKVTSHLSGLLYRTSSLIESAVFPAFVFDGEPPKLKRAEIQRREEVRREASAKYAKALSEGRIEEARIYAQASSRLTDYMLSDAERLLNLMGIPWIQAPSEGEAQAAYMSSKGVVWAAGSQDYDAILFGAPVLVRNIAITGRRKLPRKNVYVEVEPEVVELRHVLQELGLDRRQLIILGILIGTDYNPEGVPGIGPKTALSLVKKYSSLEEIRAHLKDGGCFPVDPEELVDMFLNPEVTDSFSLEWREPDVEGVVAFLCKERDFSEERVRKALDKMMEGLKKNSGRMRLEKWFG
ncbi:MAG: flap endonuclease-1 [Candidatus Bathyarchaeia archaeon]